MVKVGLWKISNLGKGNKCSPHGCSKAGTKSKSTTMWGLDGVPVKSCIVAFKMEKLFKLTVARKCAHSGPDSGRVTLAGKWYWGGAHWVTILDSLLGVVTILQKRTCPKC